jgi:hypothetical protein
VPTVTIHSSSPLLSYFCFIVFFFVMMYLKEQFVLSDFCIIIFNVQVQKVKKIILHIPKWDFYLEWSKTYWIFFMFQVIEKLFDFFFVFQVIEKLFDFFFVFCVIENWFVRSFDIVCPEPRICRRKYESNKEEKKVKKVKK